MGFQTDSFTLLASTVVTPVTTPGVLVTGPTLAGSNFTSAVVRVNVTAVSSPTITDWGVFFQSSSDGGTTWFPVVKDRTTAAGYTQLGTAAPAAADLLEATVTAFPGATFRLALYAVGSAGTITVTVTGDFEKRTPDSY